MVTNEMPPLPEFAIDANLDNNIRAYARLAIKQHMARLAPLVMEAADRYALEYDTRFYEGGHHSREERAALAKLLETEQ
jgi:hypothetical protein